ncbi:MAG: SMC-Scp complex subunit ScpB [Candidatus Zixiibacteriota bacterium]
MTDEQYRNSKVEALILGSPEPLPARRIGGVLNDLTPAQIAFAVAELNTNYAAAGSSFRIRELAGGYQFYILPEYEGVVENLLTRRRQLRLSRAALETAAIIAYRQPTTKIDIEHIRGVASDGVIRTLLEKNLIRITGRADTVGKPLQYGTTDEFLKFFGLARLEDLPRMEEIEEMIASAEPQRQTEMAFVLGSDNQPVKLNVADGTFDPERRERLEDGIPDGIDEEPSPENEGVARLVLQRQGEVAESPDEPLDPDETRAESEQPAAAGAGDS